MYLKLIIIKNILNKSFSSSKLVLEACFVSRNRFMNFVEDNFLPIPGFEPMPYVPTYLQALTLSTRPLSTC